MMNKDIIMMYQIIRCMYLKMSYKVIDNYLKDEDFNFVKEQIYSMIFLVS